NLFRTRAAQAEVSTDPLAPLQAIPQEELEQLHALATGRGVHIVVVDTGIDLAHEDLDGASLAALDLVDDAPAVPPETHATAVAGLMLAHPGNGLGIRGLAPGATVTVLRACWQPSADDAAYCNTFTLAKALAAALEADVDVLNLSL